MKTIYRVEHDGVIGVIESPDAISPNLPLAQQLIVKIGVEPTAPRLETEDFEPRARLVVLELLNHLHDVTWHREVGMLAGESRRFR